MLSIYGGEHSVVSAIRARAQAMSEAGRRRGTRTQGTMKEALGHATNDPDLEVKGKAEKVAGKIH
jgi:uncharacterized protein YjbJ (UPF0337 family)